MGTKCRIVISVLLIFFGVSFIIAGMVTLFVFPNLYRDKIRQNKVLSPESEAYSQWVEPSVPIYLNIYFFNCTNIVDFIDNRKKPVFQEVGPYVFREHRKKINITEDGSFVSYEQQKYWTFEPDQTNGTLNDMITTIDVLFFAFAHKTQFEENNEISNMVHEFKDRLYVTRSVREFLFDGYSTDFWKFARNISKIIKPDQKEFPEKFGWFYKKNETTDGIYQVNNGKENIEMVGLVNKWKNMSETPFYGNFCNSINGTAADVFPPFIENMPYIEFFSGDLCRSVTFEFLENIEVLNVDARRYVPKPFLFDDGMGDEQNKCFCTGECLLPGLLNISSCREGVPVFISFPHFLDASPSYLDNVVGLSPQRERHEFVMDLQTELGVPINVAGRMQINWLVQPIRNVRKFENLRRTFFPMIWISQNVRIDGEIAEKLEYYTKTVKYYVKLAAVSSILIGCALLSVAVLMNLIIVCMKSNKKTSEGKEYASAPTKEPVEEVKKETDEKIEQT